nr:unnamed protein product [Callosobruchus chinensis]
MRADIT